MDHFFFNFKKINIIKPLFIIGFPRSGTTLFHKTISKDSQFVAPALWEILFAPSIIQKKIFFPIKRNFGKYIKNVQIPFLNKIIARFDDIHKIRFSNPEEDYLFFLPYGGCFLLIIIMPIDDIWKLIDFDNNFPKKIQDRLMYKYKSNIQRILYFHGYDKKYLSKNPYFTSFYHTLKHNFPDANFVGCHRNPEESIPSLLSNMKEAYLIMSRDINRGNHIEKYIMIYHKYISVLKEGEKVGNNLMLIDIDQIKGNLENTVKTIYNTFDYDISTKYKIILEKESSRSKAYISRHKYDLNEYSYMDNRLIINNFNKVILFYKTIKMGK